MNAKESAAFREKVERESRIPCGPVPTPRLDAVLKQIMWDAYKIKK